MLANLRLTPSVFLTIMLVVTMHIGVIGTAHAAKVKNIIIMIPDGCGVAHMSAARLVKGEPLAQDSMNAGWCATHSANSLITGSAAAATALSSGYKTWEASPKARMLGMLPDSIVTVTPPRALPIDRQWTPVAGIMDAARKKGKATGLVATAAVTHATPAGFGTHWHDRSHDQIIMKQLVFKGFDLVFGGGMQQLVDTTQSMPWFNNEKGGRTDGVNLLEHLKARGYTVVTDSSELAALDTRTTRRVWGIFAPEHMMHDRDRHLFAPEEPSLAHMTRAAIEVLSGDPDGFVLMVEGSQVDWASHDNDPAGVISDYLAFDKAVSVALSFARKDKQTMVIVVPDHDNGGMAIGRKGQKTSAFLPGQLISAIGNARVTADGMERILRRDVDPASVDTALIRSLVHKYFGLNDLASAELLTIAKAFTGADNKPVANPYEVSLRSLLGPLVSLRAGISWTSFDHTGNDVPLYYFNAPAIGAYVDNTQIAHACAKAMNTDLDLLSRELFVPAKELFPEHTVTVHGNETANGAGVIEIAHNGQKIAFPLFTDLMIKGSDTLRTGHLALYSVKNKTPYLPRSAKGLLKAQ